MCNNNSSVTKLPLLLHLSGRCTAVMSNAGYTKGPLEKTGDCCRAITWAVKTITFPQAHRNKNFVKTQFRFTYLKYVGRGTVQTVSRRPLTSEVRVRSRISPCGICGGQTGTGTGFSPSSSVSPCQYRSTVALHTHVSSGDEQWARWWPQFRDSLIRSI